MWFLGFPILRVSDVFAFGRIFGGFAVLDDFFFGFAVSNIPQCTPRYW